MSLSRNASALFLLAPQESSTSSPLRAEEVEEKKKPPYPTGSYGVTFSWKITKCINNAAGHLRADIFDARLAIVRERLFISFGTVFIKGSQRRAQGIQNMMEA